MPSNIQTRYRRLTYGDLLDYVGYEARFFTRTPAGRLYLQKGIIDTLVVTGQGCKYFLSYPEGYVGGPLINQNDTVYIKLPEPSVS